MRTKIELALFYNSASIGTQNSNAHVVNNKIPIKDPQTYQNRAADFDAKLKCGNAHAHTHTFTIDMPMLL